MDISNRHWELWSRPCSTDFALYRLNYAGYSNLVYDPSAYDDTPQYDWDASSATFECSDTTMHAQGTEMHNNMLFVKLIIVICQKLQIPYQHHGCKFIFMLSFNVPSCVEEPSQNPIDKPAIQRKWQLHCLHTSI